MTARVDGAVPVLVCFTRQGFLQWSLNIKGSAMLKTFLYASIIGIGLGLTGPTQVAFANGFFHHHTWSQSSSFAAPAITTQAFAVPMAAPMMTTQAFTVPMAAPMMTTQAFAVPVAATQAFSSAAPSVSQAAMQYALVPIQANGQTQAQALNAVPQFGVSDITSILDLLGKLRGALSRSGNGGSLNPGGGGTGLDTNRPIEVRVTISADGSTTPTSGSGTSPDQNQQLLDFLKKNGVQFAAPSAVAQAAQASAQSATIETKIDTIMKRLEDLRADVDALKKAGK